MTARSRQQLLSHTGHGLAALPDRPRLSPQAVQRLARQLPDRDLWLLQMLDRHTVFTTTQLTDLAFDTATGARHRLHHLYTRRVLDRFRPSVAVGSAPWHYLLSRGGAAILAAHLRTDTRTLAYRDDQLVRVAASRNLAHTIDTNQFFVALTAAARHDPRHLRLHEWWPARQCQQAWGGRLVRPDGYGVWTEQRIKHGITHQTRSEFFVEIDRGTEQLVWLTRKIAGYTALARSTGITTTVLFQLPTAARETRLLLALGTPAIPVATTTAELAQAGPHRPIWRRPGQSTGRMSLADVCTASRPVPATGPT
jgi:hypothetical protein